MTGTGTLKLSGFGSNSTARESVKVGFDYFKANGSRVSASVKVGDHDYHLMSSNCTTQVLPPR